MDPLIQISIAQIRCLTSHKSSIDPDPTTVGIADKKPQMNLPMIIAANELPAPTRAQNAVYATHATTFAGLLPKLSVYGGRISPPKAWPKKNLRRMSRKSSHRTKGSYMDANAIFEASRLIPRSPVASGATLDWNFCSAKSSRSELHVGNVPLHFREEP